MRFYVTNMGPLYADRLRQLGQSEAVDQVTAAPGEVPQILLDELTLCGDAAAARRGLQRWQAAGADMPIVTLPPKQSIDELDDILDALAPTSHAERYEQRRRTPLDG